MRKSRIKKQIKYDVFVYTGSIDHSTFVSFFCGVPNLHECIIRCNVALSVIFKLEKTGYCKICVDGSVVGYYEYYRNDNIFVFRSTVNWFNNLPKKYI